MPCQTWWKVGCGPRGVSAARQALTAILVTLPGALLPGQPLGAEDWPAWRGPQGTGHSAESRAPLTWSASQSVKWKVPLDGPGNSSPIVVRGRVLITHAPAGTSLRGLRCYDRRTGELLWKHEVPWAEEEKTHQTNPPCSSSPVSDGQRVVAWYGSAGLWCYDLEGKVLWQRDLGRVEHIWGYGSSPVLHGDHVILNFGPGLNAFVVALDKHTGREVWRREFPDQKSETIDEYRGSWSTPVLLPGQGERAGSGDAPGHAGDLVLLSLPQRLWAVDLQTGEDRWSCGGLSNLVYTSPLIGERAVVVMCGYGGPALAVPFGGRGDQTEQVLWRHPRNPQRVGSGVIVGRHLYILNEPGIAWCLDVNSGEKTWEQRLGSGNSWCSMVHAAGRLYITNTAGTTFVLAPDPSACRVLAENPLGELTRASPAFSDGEIFIRTYQHLYCIAAAP